MDRVNECFQVFVIDLKINSKTVSIDSLIILVKILSIREQDFGVVMYFDERTYENLFVSRKLIIDVTKAIS